MTSAPVVRTQRSFVKWAVLALLSYWLVYALVAPLTVYDAHVYNVARLLIIQKGGFFGNHLWNLSAQITYPWGFDAIHYLPLCLGGGFALPSFACLVGLLVVVHQLVGRRYTPSVAWWCDLTLLAMPTVVYQATSAKNDLAGVFAVAVWYYALCRWDREGRRIHLVWMALALAFNAGTKFSGPPITALLTLYSLWRLRALSYRQILGFAGALAVFFALFGSAETYLNNELLFGHALGPPEFIRFHRNTDGLAGGAANFIRYFFGTMNVGVDACNPQSPVPGWLGAAGRGTLHFMGLDNVGYRNDFNDQSFVVLKIGMEAASDFGPIGALALIATLCLCVTRTPGDPLWKISAGGLAALVQTCLMVGWMPWNNRFLLLPFVLFGVAFTLYLLRDGPRAHRRKVFLGILLFYSAIVYPLHSLNKKPADVLLALTHRQSLALKERPAMGEIVNDLKERVRAGQAAPLVLTAGVDSWTYDIMDIRNLKVLPTPLLNRQTLLAAAAKTGASRLLVLTLNRPLNPSLSPELQLLNIYTEQDSALYLWSSTPQAETSQHRQLLTRFTSGWYDEEKSPEGPFRWMSAAGDIHLSADRAGTLVMEARVRSLVAENTLDVLMDNQPVGSVVMGGVEWQDCVLRVPVLQGMHRLTVRSRQPGTQPPGDSRTLTFCTMNFRFRLDP